MLNKKAVSGVVVMVVMIALVISISAIVFTTTKKTVEEKIKKSQACGPDIIGKLSINSEYVCYDSVTDEIVFSINREDVDLDKLIIAIETETEVTQINLKEIAETINNLYPYNKARNLKGDKVALPAKDAGKTYIGKGFSKPIIGIKIIPVINGEQCEVADSLNEIIDCRQTTIFNN
ncbi:MAG TPA: hypothetical protein VJA20_00155 [Candidatus Nanoarchaeia archaeon]|nr:hypothetical protein [Candidatus Nanoarchaeia archaeon]